MTTGDADPTVTEADRECVRRWLANDLPIIVAGTFQPVVGSLCVAIAAHREASVAEAVRTYKEIVDGLSDMVPPSYQFDYSDGWFECPFCGAENCEQAAFKTMSCDNKEVWACGHSERCLVTLVRKFYAERGKPDA